MKLSNFVKLTHSRMIDVKLEIERVGKESINVCVCTPKYQSVRRWDIIIVLC